MLLQVPDNRWKYRFAADGGEAKPELFNLDWDPAEQYNVYEQNRETGERLAVKLRTMAKELTAD